MSNLSIDEGRLVHLCVVLVQSMSPDAGQRQQAMEALDAYTAQHDALNYFCFVLVEGSANRELQTRFAEHELQTVCATAGMVLKNMMLQHGSGAKYDLSYLRTNIMNGLYLPVPLLANITGIVLTTLFSHYYRHHREDASGVQTLSDLLALASQGNLAALKALSKIMEDNAQFFHLPWAGNDNILDVLITHFLKFMDELPNPTMRAEAIKCLNYVVPLQPQCLLVKLDRLLEGLFRLASADSDDVVRQQLCIMFSNLLEHRPDKLAAHMVGIVQFALHVMETSKDEKVALDACEYLFAFASSPNVPKNMVRQHLSEIVPMLLRKMVYNEDDIMSLEADNEGDADEDDNDEDIKPTTSKVSGRNDRADNEEDDVGGADDDTVVTNWNLKKCSAATLDAVTKLLPRAVVEIAFPLLSEYLASSQWYIREATILALGAMADGGMQYFAEQLPNLVPFLVEQLNDHWAPVRKITCWTLSRFSPWILNDRTEFLIPVLGPIMNTLLDKKKGVQEAAITAVAVFVENCDPDVVETVLYSELLNSFDRCLQSYKKKNLIILYDAIGRLAEKTQMDDDAIKLILPHLITKWASLGNNDKELWPLLECLSYVAASLGEKFSTMAPEVYQRAWQILCNCVELEAQAQTDPSIEVPEKDFVITSLDLIDGLVQGLRSHSCDLLFPNNDLTMLQVMLQCLQDPTHDVRQSTFALLGDIATFYDPALIQPFLPAFLKAISTELMHSDLPEAVSSVNNAVWCLGLIGQRRELGDAIIGLARQVLDLFCTPAPSVHESVLENLVVTIGRLGHLHPEHFAGPPFAMSANLSRWCQLSKELQDPEEKSAAYYGFIKIANLMTSASVLSDKALHHFIQGLASDIGPDTLALWKHDIYAFFMKHRSQLEALVQNLTDDETAVVSFITNN
ncbi:FAER219Cp [Eremothecium gossypii FDAG1]|nr:FAER219Cp [Eremothecium gossypii FDAG1]